MYRAGRGELDERIARCTAAIEHGRHLRGVDAGLGAEEHRLRAMLGAIELAIVMRAHDGEGASLARLWALLWGQRREQRVGELLEQADRAILAAALEHQLDQVRAQRREVARQLATVADAPAHLERLLSEKEAWLERIGAPSAAEALALAERIGHWRALDQALESATAIAYEAQNELRRAIVFVEDARDRHRNNYTPRRSQRAQAAAHAGIADGFLRRLEIELEVIADSCAALGIATPEFVMERTRPPLSAEPLRREGHFGVDINDAEVSETDLRREQQWVSGLISGAREVRQIAAMEIDRLLQRRRQLLSS